MKNSIRVAALYKFVRLDDYRALKPRLVDCCRRYDVVGSLLLASEGINGTIAGTARGVEAVLEHLRTDPRLTDLSATDSFTNRLPFQRMKVLLKKEIVTLGIDVDPNERSGIRVQPEDWNDLISDPDVTVIDTRNDYEVHIGTFAGAINPQMESFRELPERVEAAADIGPGSKVAMFCTGGIRCEKSTAWLRDQGVEQVYQLEGGILAYLDSVPEEESLWRGECFVFDQRVALGHGLRQGTFDSCPACGWPIDQQDKEHPAYVAGKSCPHCAHGAKAAQEDDRPSRPSADSKDSKSR